MAIEITKRGMTRKRWEEIHRRYLSLKESRDRQAPRSIDGAIPMLIELVAWIDNEGGFMDFDAEPQPEPDVITGPGEYEVVKCSYRLPRRPPVGTLVKIKYDGRFPETPWRGQYAARGFDYFNGKGETSHGKCVIRPHVPAPAKPEPRLEEPLADGLWWVWWHADQQRAKAHVYRAKASDNWLVELVQERTVHFVSDDGAAINGSLQLIRRVKQPTVGPYVSDEDKGAMFGKTVRRKKDGQELPVIGVDCGGVSLKGLLFPAWASFARDYERLDGSPCGIVENVDPWDLTDPEVARKPWT